MENLENKIREVAKGLLKEKKVDLFLGYERGTLPLRTTPLFLRDPLEAENLVWDVTCENNLVKYLIGTKERIAILAKGCDLRTLVEVIKERQVVRENVIILGIGCKGVVDRKKLDLKLKGREILEGNIKDGIIEIKGENFTEELEVEELLDPSCLVCRHKNTLFYDLFIGEKVPAQEARDEFTEVLTWEGRSSEEKWKHFKAEMEKCIRCYACREACPLCYCKECFVDCASPCWLGKTIDPSDNFIYHLSRNLHLAGRCVDCGACNRACPLDVGFRLLQKKMEKDIRQLYGYDSGISLEEISPLGTYRLGDVQDFIL